MTDLCTISCTIPHDFIGLILIVIGFIAGTFVKVEEIRLPIQVSIFLLRMIKWYLDTHPHGMKMAKETDVNEEFHRLFGVILEKHDSVDNSQNSVS